jgi:hypothetical protein
MRRLSLVLAALVAGSLVAEAGQRSGGPPLLEAPRGTGAISGVVTDATTGRPVEGAIVSLGITTGGPIILTLPRVMTDPKGRFLFRDLAPSPKYYIRAARVGYAPARFGSSGPGLPSSLSEMEIRTTDDIVTVTVAADQWVSALQIRLWRLGSITGRVLDERGEPVVGVAVRGFSSTLVAGHPQFVGTDVVSTDDRGEYRLANLMPGEYAVTVLSVQATVLDSTPEAVQRRAIGELSRLSGGSNPGLPTIDVDGTHRLAISNFATPPPPSATAPRAYAAQFYPGAPTISNARLIDVAYGAARRGVDFQLYPVPAVKVSGRINLTGPGDAASLLLRLMPAGSERLGVGSEAATTVVERDGSFTFLNVPAGEYTLLAQGVFGELTSGNGEVSLPDAPGLSAAAVGQAPMGSSLPGVGYSGRSGKASVWGRASVAVGASDVTDLVLPMHPAITVRGRVVMASGASGLSLSGVIGAQPASGDPSLGRIAKFVTISGETPFTLEGLGGGTYLIGLPSFFGQFAAVASVTSGGREIRDTGLDTTGGRDVDDVVITLTENVTSIQGTVRGDDAAGAAVIVFPVDRARWADYGWDPILIASKAADNTGAFLMKGLPEGDYFAVAVDRSQHDAWTDPKFLQAASAVATRIALKWGEKKSLDLQVSKVVVK